MEPAPPKVVHFRTCPKGTLPVVVWCAESAGSAPPPTVWPKKSRFGSGVVEMTAGEGWLNGRKTGLNPGAACAGGGGLELGSSINRSASLFPALPMVRLVMFVFRFSLRLVVGTRLPGGVGLPAV